MKYILPVFITVLIFIISALLGNFISPEAGLAFALLCSWPNAFFFAWWVSK